MGQFKDEMNDHNNDLNELANEVEEESFADIDQPPVFPDGIRDEEIASEITPENIGEKKNRGVAMQENNALGWVALALSIISFFIMPIILGVAAIITGFVARSRDIEWLGNIAIAIGTISVLARLFIYPFF